MTLDGTYTAVVDRIEDGVAVLLVEEDGETVEELHVDPAALPRGATGGSVVEATFEDGNLEALENRPGETERRKQELESRFEQLAERPPDRDDRDGGDAGDGGR